MHEIEGSGDGAGTASGRKRRVSYIQGESADGKEAISTMWVVRWVYRLQRRRRDSEKQVRCQGTAPSHDEKPNVVNSSHRDQSHLLPGSDRMDSPTVRD